MERKEIQDLEQLASDPAGSYVLTADVDMTGKHWIPVDFSGILDGNGHVVRNLQICGRDRENAGLFGLLSGKAENLHLQNARVDAQGAKFAGVLAGTVTGQATGCTVSGELCGGACAGAVAGQVAGRLTGGDTLTVKTGPRDKWEQTGLCADVFMDGKAALVGKILPGGTASGLWRDNTHRLEKLPQVLQDRRQKAIDYMRAMATVQWQVDQDKLEYVKNRRAPKCIHYQCYERGKTYMGIPYAHSAGSLARFLTQMARKDAEVYIAKPNLQNGEYYVGEAAEALADEGISHKDIYGFTQYMGTDCSSAVSWAWRQVSGVDMAEGGCYGRYSGNMIPTKENEKEHGILPVGDFYAPEENSRLALDAVGEERIFEAFAKAVRGDALAGFDTSGHVLLISFDPVVIRDAAGKIDPNRSFLVTIEQGGGFYDSKGTDNLFKADLPEPIQVSWRVDYRYYFDDMVHWDKYTDVAQKRKMVGCNHCYLPITMQALQQENTPAATPRVWMEGATVRSNFYIMATQMEGQPVHTQISHDWHIYREFPVTAVDLAAVHSLQPGTYTAKIHLSNGHIEPVEFTVS